MINKIFILYLLSITSIYAYDKYPFYTSIDDQLSETTKFEVSDIPPTMSQDDIGVCYGFSATVLLDNYRCKEMKKDCNNSSELLAPLDVIGFYNKPNPTSPKNLKEGGRAGLILDNLKRNYNGDKKIAKEECVNFASLLHQGMSKNSLITNEKMGWNFLIQKWNEYKLGNTPKDNDCVSCMANDIKSQMQNLRSSNQQIENALKTAYTAEDFLYKAILPIECLDSNAALIVPDYKLSVFPNGEVNTKASTLMEKVESLVLNNIPVEMAICAEQPRGDSCPENDNKEAVGHSIVISGIKELCNEDKTICKKMAKVKNSWGERWQINNNDGWVNFEKLCEASILLDKRQQITWIQNPNTKLVDKKISAEKESSSNHDSSSGIEKPAAYKNYRGLWKCPNGVYQEKYANGCVPFKS